MRKSEREDRPVDRRSFLQIAGLGAGAAGLAAVSMTASGSEAGAAAKAAGHDQSGYRETDHVRAYYRLAQF